jgi:hypothetical protein
VISCAEILTSRFFIVAADYSTKPRLRVCTSDDALVNEEVQNMKTNAFMRGVALVWMALLVWCDVGAAQNLEGHPDQVLEWNQIFIETLIATNTANSSSQRLGAIVHTAIFDAYNGIETRYTPIFVDNEAPNGASRRAAVIAAAYTNSCRMAVTSCTT